MAWAGGVLCQQYFSWVQYEILSTGSGKFQSAGKGDYILLFWRGVPVVFRVRRGFLEVQSADIGHDLLINRAFDDVRQVVGPCAQPERFDALGHNDGGSGGMGRADRQQHCGSECGAAGKLARGRDLQTKSMSQWHKHVPERDKLHEP